MYYLYHIHRPENESIQDGYIGITNKPKQRWAQHKRECKLGRRNYPLYNAMRKDEVVFEILCIGSREYIHELEFKIRPLPDMGWNLAVGGSDAGGNTWKGKKRPEHSEAMKKNGFQAGNAAGNKPVYIEGFIFPSRMIAHQVLRIDYKTIYNRIKNPKFDYFFIPVED